MNQFKIDDSKIRLALKNKIAKEYPIVVATCLMYTDNLNIDRYINIWIYGDRVKTIEMTFREGYKLNRKLIKKIPKKQVSSSLYAELAYQLEKMPPSYF